MLFLTLQVPVEPISVGFDLLNDLISPADLSIKYLIPQQSPICHAQSIVPALNIAAYSLVFCMPLILVSVSTAFEEDLSNLICRLITLFEPECLVAGIISQSSVTYSEA